MFGRTIPEEDIMTGDALTTLVEQSKRDFLNELKAEGDPNAEAIYAEFCKRADAMVNDLRPAFSRLERIYENTRQAFINILIACHQGDVGEAQRLADEL